MQKEAAIKFSIGNTQSTVSSVEEMLERKREEGEQDSQGGSRREGGRSRGAKGAIVSKSDASSAVSRLTNRTLGTRRRGQVSLHR